MDFSVLSRFGIARHLGAPQHARVEPLLVGGRESSWHAGKTTLKDRFATVLIFYTPFFFRLPY